MKVGEKPSFDEYFHFLDGKYKCLWTLEPMKSYGTNRPSLLRLYAIKLGPNCYLIVYGGIKLGDTIQNSPVLKDKVFNKIDNVLNYLKDMKFNVEKLKQMSRPMTDEEKKDIEFRKENREWLAVSERLALKLRRILRTEGILQSELAERMGVTPAQVTKILSGKENLGLKTISKIENAIGHSLIEVTMEDNHPVVEYESRTVCRPFTTNRYAEGATAATTARRRSVPYSSIVAHTMFS